MVYSLNSYLRGLFGYSNGKDVDDKNGPQQTDSFCESVNENHQKRVQTEDKKETSNHSDANLNTTAESLEVPGEEYAEENLANNLQNSNSVNNLAFANSTHAKMLSKQNSRRRNSKRFVIGDETEEESAVNNHENGDFPLPVPNVEWLKAAARLKPVATLT